MRASGGCSRLPHASERQNRSRVLATRPVREKKQEVGPMAVTALTAAQRSTDTLLLVPAAG
jgi:hypothetical protein